MTAVAWTAGNVIALVSVIVTGLVAVISFGLNAWLAKRRMAHEDEMQTTRLDHERQLHESRLAYERAEAVRITAATAYSKAREVVQHINLNTIHTVAASYAAGTEANRITVGEAMDALGFVTALGWTSDVRDSAGALSDEISKLANAAWTTAGSIRRGNQNEGRMMDCLGERVDAVLAAMDTYREAVAGD